MKLEGSLDAFGLPDVLTLLATTGKSGGLLLRRATDDERGRTEGAVWFRDGRVCGATSDRSRASLVRRVVGSGAVDDNALRQAVARAVSGGGGVARALLDAGSVDPELLRQAADDQAVDAVFDLLRWGNGDFAFDPASTDPEDIGLSLEHDRLLAEARARVDAWEALVVVIPSPDAVVSVPTVLAHDPEVSRDEWALLSLVDGHRRVQDLVELTGAGEFAVTTILARLVQRGLLHVKDASAPDHVSVVERRLGMLASIEGRPVTEPPVEAEPVHSTPVEDLPPAPGSLGMTAAAALAAARAAQGLPQPGVPGAGGSRPRHEVVPPRPEPFLPGRRPEHPEPEPERVAGASARASSPAAPAYGLPSAPSQPSVSVEGATARSLTAPEPLAAPDPRHDAMIERDPSVNRSLLLRLIAGVRGL